ncbi:MAG: TIGR04053 family radical SAM/SPASM domain-containing protein [Candidatus Nanopelagicales bacterium]
MGHQAEPEQSATDQPPFAPMQALPHAERRHRAEPGPRSARAIGAVRPDGWVYARAPMIVYWELTIACGLACRHCRATAMPDAAPGQLDTAEAMAVLDDIARFGQPAPHVVLTGGDPLRRPDLDAILAGADERGIGVSLAPAVTPDLTRERLAQLQAAGVQAISLSLDGSDSTRHDGLRGVPGTFESTIQALGWAADIGLPVQVNTLVTAETAPDLPAVHELLLTRRLMRWSLFFLISVGRGAQLSELAPGEAERLMGWLLDIGREAPFQIKTTEAMQYRRVAAMRMRRAGMTDGEIERSPISRGFGIRDGNGIMFIAHDGTVTPSGFLPLAIGNVRTDDLVALYRHGPLMVALRDATQLKGRCGRCAYAAWCGGSRARAYAWTGDPLESDPLCPYTPPRAARTPAAT